MFTADLANTPFSARLHWIFLPLSIGPLRVASLRWQDTSNDCTLVTAEGERLHASLRPGCLITGFALYLTLYCPTAPKVNGWLLSNQVDNTTFRRLSRWINNVNHNV